MKVIKRNGTEVDLDLSRIESAIRRALESAGSDTSNAMSMALEVVKDCSELNREVHVEEIQDITETVLMRFGRYKAAKNFIAYRYQHAGMRQKSGTDEKILSLLERSNEEIRQENANKNPVINSVQRDYMAGEVSKDITRRFLLPPDILDAHDKGLIHFHDADYFAQHMHNCCLVNLDDMLQNGTVISRTRIEKPHSFSTACNIATQIIAQVASSQYGGQTISLAHLSPFVDVSRQQIRKEVAKEAFIFQEGDDPKNALPDWKIDHVTEKRLKREIARGVQTLQYQIITLMTTNGQTPFVSICMDLNEAPEGQPRHDLAMVISEVLDQRIAGVKNEQGVPITPAFPKLLYVLDEFNAHPGSEYWGLTVKAAQCTAKRMVPDYISAKKMRELKINGVGHGDVYPCMGCRSFLTPDRSGNGFDNVARAKNDSGKPKYYGRFNQGVVTISLPDVACSANGDEELFWRIFDERLELCYRALMIRHNRLKGTPVTVAPILWQYGALSRLDEAETIDSLLYDGYSTLSLGYAGLAECVWRMKGCSHTSDEGKAFGLAVMKYMNDKCAEWKSKENIDFSLYGTPIESTTYKFARCLQRRFGIIEHVSDKSYITNSYHVHVTEPIDAFTKLSFESEFQALSPGGAISYVEVPDMQNNIGAVLAVIRHIYDHIIYAELNTKSDYCQKCGWDGEIQIVECGGKLVWRCPQCGNTDETTMNIARRTCGYIGTNGFNQGRTQEIKERVLHL